MLMMSMNCRIRVSMVLTATTALLLLSYNAVNASSSGLADYPDCTGNITYIGDGYCDTQTNNAACGYDDGDCCECTCVDANYTCGTSGFVCVDPNSPCQDETTNSGGNDETPSPSDSSSGVADYPDCTGTVSFSGDGDCDSQNNSAGCGYDGGDCCDCTCVDADFVCGASGFDCVDPSASCEDETTTSGGTEDSSSSSSSICPLASIGDGSCDALYNTEECDYDGGDCCECTCVDAENVCDESEFDCVDPSASCEEETTTSGGNEETPSPSTSSTGLSSYPDCTGTVVYFGDGDCDSQNNNDVCGYDGGDCCACTCVDGGFVCGVSGFVCIDPNASCEDETTTSGGTEESSTSSSSSSCPSAFIGDGSCDALHNTKECDYDGGDCCECTCVDAENACGESEFDCVDPNVSCEDETTTSGGNESTPSPSDSSSRCPSASIGDGSCDALYNTEECDYDGGDCCECTCVDAENACDESEFDCIDLSASCEDETTTTSRGNEESSSLSSSLCPSASVGDGSCDALYNTEECDYDRGDCCECTCFDTAPNTCGDFDCQDPDVSCNGLNEPNTSGAARNLPLRVLFAVCIFIGLGL